MQVHRRLQFAVFYLDEGLVTPCVAIEYPAREHLLGGESLITACTVNLLAEVDGEGLHRTDTVVV